MSIVIIGGSKYRKKGKNDQKALDNFTKFVWGTKNPKGWWFGK